MEISERLQALRAVRKEMQVQVAEAIERAPRQYRGLAGAASAPNFYSLFALADRFGVSLDYLTGRSDQR